MTLALGPTWRPANSQCSIRVLPHVTVLVPCDRHVAAEAAAEEDAVEIREHFDGEVGAEDRTIFGAEAEGEEPVDYGLFGWGNRPSGVILPHHFCGRLVAGYEWAFVGSFENAPVVEVDVGLTAGVGRSGVFAEWLEGLLEQMLPKLSLPRCIHSAVIAQ